MQAAVKLAPSPGELAPLSAPEIQLELLPKCALRAALLALTKRSIVESEQEAGATPEAGADLYSLMKNCVFFNGGDCHCHTSAPSIKTGVRVIYQSRQQL
jgi:hypothetical protein